MKRLAYLLLSLLGISLGNLFAQAPNLVSNGDFESVTGYPAAQGELFRASGWSNCNGFFGWPYGTPDLFHVNGVSPMQLPNTSAGSVNPYQGNAIAGFITHNGYVSNFREYMSYHFPTPLEVGQTYAIEFYLTNGYANWYGRRGSNNIGVALTMTQPTQIQHEPLALTPQIEITTVVHHTDWRKYSFLYTPSQPLEYITIGNFRNDISTTYANMTTGQDFAYYFIDMVSVSKVILLPAESIQLHQYENEDALELAWQVPADALGDQLVLERSSDQQRFETVHDFGKVENPEAETHYTDAAALPGITYYYRLRDLTPNGETKYSSLVEARFGNEENFVAGDIYPNPVRDRFSLGFAAVHDGTLSVDIVDAAGRTVVHDEREIAIGQDDPSYSLPTDLIPGVYQARFQFGGETFTKKLMVTGVL